MHALKTYPLVSLVTEQKQQENQLSQTNQHSCHKISLARAGGMVDPGEIFVLSNLIGNDRYFVSPTVCHTVWSVVSHITFIIIP